LGLPSYAKNLKIDNYEVGWRNDGEKNRKIDRREIKRRRRRKRHSTDLADAQDGSPALNKEFYQLHVRSEDRCLREDGMLHKKLDEGRCYVLVILGRYKVPPRIVNHCKVRKANHWWRGEEVTNHLRRTMQTSRTK